MNLQPYNQREYEAEQALLAPEPAPASQPRVRAPQRAQRGIQRTAKGEMPK